MPATITRPEVTAAGAARTGRRWLAAYVGGGSGLAAGLCCAGSAIAAGADLGALSFFTVWMDRDQPYVIAVTLLLAGWWLARALRAMTAGRGAGPWWRRLARAGRPALVHAAVCLGSYGLVLALAMGASAIVRGM
jgi:hypothetical protein